MNDVADCRAMELLYRERAKADPEHSGKWLGQADRWRELANKENAWRLQKRGTQQMQHAGRWRSSRNQLQAIGAGNRWGKPTVYSDYSCNGEHRAAVKQRDTHGAGR